LAEQAVGTEQSVGMATAAAGAAVGVVVVVEGVEAGAA
jgi:hypothetical protein